MVVDVLLAARLGAPPAVPLLLTAAYGIALMRPWLAGVRRRRAVGARKRKSLARRA